MQVRPSNFPAVFSKLCPVISTPKPYHCKNSFGFGLKEEMEIVQVLHMNKGVGETSYAKNSKLQYKIMSMAKPVMEDAILELLSTNLPESMDIADLGCSSGPNTLLVISQMIDIMHAKCCQLGRPMPELRISLNDLPNNDFNNICGSLPAFYNQVKAEKGDGFGPYFISVVPGSFYGRLFPRQSLHFVHSSSSLQWLSQVPPGLDVKAMPAAMNKGKVYVSETSPQSVLDSYLLQFQKDFSLFLKSRREEVVPGGRMVLSFLGRRSMDPTTEESCYHWELLAKALMSMVSEGIIPEEKVNGFNFPYYSPCAQEVELEIRKDGSFLIDRLEAFEINWDGGVELWNTVDQTLSKGQRMAKTIRAAAEPILESCFGSDIMDDLFQRYGRIVDNHLSETRAMFMNLVISLIRKG